MYSRNNYIEKNKKGRRFVIGSIYGCLYSFQHLLFSKIKLTKHDQLFLLGNYIDKGNNSREVLDFIIELISEDYQIFPVRGRQEENLIAMLEEDEDVLELYLSINHSTDLLVDHKIPQKYISFLHNLSYFYEIDNAFLVHSGFNLKHPRPFVDKLSMLYVQNTRAEVCEFTEKKIFAGNVPQTIDELQDCINEDQQIIHLNNAAYRASEADNINSEWGNIIALELDSAALIVQPNLDMMAEETDSWLSFQSLLYN